MTAVIRDFLLDPDTGDLAVVNGDFAVVSDAEAVRQGIQVRLKMYRGEYWLDEGVGVPWLDQVLIKSPNRTLIQNLLHQVIASTPDVVLVEDTSLQVNSDRTATIAYTVRTRYGTIVVGEVTIP